jgi:uncharacterized Zn finger protein (UPF0148 family)
MNIGIWLNWTVQAARNAPDGLRKLGGLLNKPSGKELARQAEETRNRLDAFENARRFCDNCKTEMSNLDALYCPKCGNSRISSRSQIRERELAKEQSKEQKRLEEVSRIRAAKAHEEQQRQQQIQAEAHLEAVRRRCREIAALRFCARCRGEREIADEFCIKCGGVLQQIPSSVAFELAKKEFPDCVHTKEDFDRFVK